MFIVAARSALEIKVTSSAPTQVHVAQFCHTCESGFTADNDVASVSLTLPCPLCTTQQAASSKMTEHLLVIFHSYHTQTDRYYYHSCTLYCI